MGPPCAVVRVIGGSTCVQAATPSLNLGSSDESSYFKVYGREGATSPRNNKAVESSPCVQGVGKLREILPSREASRGLRVKPF